MSTASRVTLNVTAKDDKGLTITVDDRGVQCDSSTSLSVWLVRPIERAIAIKHLVLVRMLDGASGVETVRPAPLDPSAPWFPEALRSYVASLLPGLTVTIVEPSATIPRRDRVRSRLASLLTEPEVTSAAEQALQVIDQLDEQAIQALDDLTSQQAKT